MSRVSTRLVTKTELWLFLVSLFGICLKAIFSPLWRHLISPFLKRLRILRSVSESGCGHQHPEVFTILDTHLDFSVFSIQVVVAWTELQCSYSSSVACPGLDDSFWKGGLLLVQNSKSMYLFFPPPMNRISALQIRCDFPVGARRRAVERRTWISPRPEPRWAAGPWASVEGGACSVVGSHKYQLKILSSDWQSQKWRGRT